MAGSVAALLRFYPYNGSKVYIYFYLYNNVVSHLEYLSGGKVNWEGLRVLLGGKDDSPGQVLATAAFPVPLLHNKNNGEFSSISDPDGSGFFRRTGSESVLFLL